MTKILQLVLKDVWYNKICSGEKKHEYREYKDYWIKRLNPPEKWEYVIFQKAYRKNPEKMMFKINKISVLSPGTRTDLETSNAVFDIELGNRIK